MNFELSASENLHTVTLQQFFLQNQKEKTKRKNVFFEKLICIFQIIYVAFTKENV